MLTDRYMAADRRRAARADRAIAAIEAERLRREYELHHCEAGRNGCDRLTSRTWRGRPCCDVCGAPPGGEW